MEQGLERLAEGVETKDHRTPADRVKDQMASLTKGYLPGYVEAREGVYRLGPKWRDNPRTRNPIAARVREWVLQTGALTILTGE